MNNILEVKIDFTPRKAYEYIRDNKQIDGEVKSNLEKIIAQDSEWAYEYAVNVLKSPFPAGEAAIAKDACLSYEYSRVLEAPFPLGETQIAKDAECSYYYAKYVLKAPFPLGEAIIAKDALWAYYYALNVLKGRFYEAEETIADSSHKEEYENHFNIKL